MSGQLYYQDQSVTLYCGDCLEFLPQIEKLAIDVCITDPPYSAHVHAKSMRGATGAEIAAKRELGFEALEAQTRFLVSQELWRLIKRWVLVFSDVESCGDWRRELCGAPSEPRFDYIRTGAWIKRQGAPQFTGDRPGTGFEAITICHRPGKKHWNGRGRPALWEAPVVNCRSNSVEPRVHEAQKPLGLMKALLSDFTDAGELVLDTFAGSGTTLVAAKILGRRGLGFEKRERDCENAAKRLEQGALFSF